MNEDEDLDDEDLDDEDLESCYEGEIPEFETCMMCEEPDVPSGDRWKFHLVDSEGVKEPSWICRSCHGKFESVEEFERFRRNAAYSRLYRLAERLQRFILFGAPKSVITSTVFGTLVGSLFLPDDMGGSEDMRKLAGDELVKLVDRVTDRKD